MPKVEDLNMDDDIPEQIEEQEQVPEIEENKPVIESNIKVDESFYVYEKQLNVLLGMGFDDVEKIRNLLNAHDGDVNVVIGLLLA